MTRIQKLSRRSRWLGLCFAVVIVLIGGYYGCLRFANRELNSLFELEAQHGRYWTCASLDRQGLLVDVSYQCAQASLKVVQGGSDRDVGFTAELASLRMDWSLFAPAHVKLIATAPLSGTLANFPFKIDWQMLAATLDGTSTLSARTEMQVDHVLAVMSAPGSATHSAEHVSFDVGPLVKGNQTLSLPVFFEASGVASPVLRQIFRSDSLLSVDFRGDITHPETLIGANVPENLERWQQAGGVFHIQRAYLSATDLTVNAEGVLAFDSQHRLIGDLSLKIVGGEALLSQYGYGPKAGLMGSLLGGLMKGNGVTLPLYFADGRVTLGPLKLPVKLVALY